MGMLNKSCRWEDVVENILQPVEVLFYNGEPDYQGSAEVLVRRADGMLILYGWSWGSCSSCDAWEDEAPSKVDDEIRHNMQVMEPDVAVGYLQNRIRERKTDPYPEEERAIERCMALATEQAKRERYVDDAWAGVAKALKD